jgi:hypothetical protein
MIVELNGDVAKGIGAMDTVASIVIETGAVLASVMRHRRRW